MGPRPVYEGKSRAGSADILGLDLELGLGPGIWAKADLGLLLGVFELGTMGKVGPPQHTPQCQVALGSGDGRPGSAEGQQQSRLGRL